MDGSAGSSAALRASTTRAPRLSPFSSVGARDAGGGRAHVLRRPHVLVPRRQSAGGSRRARPDGVFNEAGYDAHDVTWGIVTLRDGAVINLGVSYALPARYPTLGQSDRVELLGAEGTMIIDDDHMDHLLFSERGIPHAYVPDHSVKMAFLGSNTAGDWACGDFWGPLGNETRSWLDHWSRARQRCTRRPSRRVSQLETTIAIERAATTGKTIRLPLET